MNQLESLGVLFIGIGGISGSIATIQLFSVALFPSVFIIFIGIIVTLAGRYR